MFKHKFVHTPCTFKQEFIRTLCTFKHFQVLFQNHYKFESQLSTLTRLTYMVVMTRIPDNFTFEILHQSVHVLWCWTDTERVQLLVVGTCVDFDILCYFSPDEVQLSAPWFILKIVKSSFPKDGLPQGLSGDQLARDVLGDAHDPIDGGKDDNHTRHTPLSHHHCNPANLKEGQIFLY